MHDLRFYTRSSDITVAELAEACSAELVGSAESDIVTVSASQNAEPGALCFYDGRADKSALISSDITACFVKSDAVEHLPDGVTALIVENPRYEFSIFSERFLIKRDVGLAHDDLGPAKVAASARIGQHAVLSDGVEIGENAVIGPNVVIAPGVRIGEGTVIGPGCFIECALIGNHVVVKANTVIGGTGFGIVGTPEGVMHAPHFGRVIIQDHVSIGSSCCIDRGMFDDTIIGERSRTDNLVQIAHNTVIGRNCTIAAFGGISGSNKIGDFVQLGGRVGTADHISIGDKARLAAYSGLMKDVPPGETWGGSPAKPLKTMLREMTWLAKNAAIRKKKD